MRCAVKSDKLKGGKADNKKQSEFDSAELAEGIKHEMEHTNDKSIAKEIAMDHLAEDPKYYTKLKEIEKYDRVDEEADGKKELDYGVEELDKVLDRWKKLKKALTVLDNSNSIIDISSQEYNEDEEAPEEPAGEEQPEEAPPEEGEAPPEEGAEDEEDYDDQKIEEMLREQGYSDAEIAHVLHDHTPDQQTLDDIKMDAETASSQHKIDHQKRMDDLDYEAAQQDTATNDIDREHKQRMLDLEYENAQKLKEMELKFKEQEYSIKLEAMKDKNKKAQVSAGSSPSRDAAKTSKAERKGNG